MCVQLEYDISLSIENPISIAKLTEVKTRDIIECLIL
jgi:hypothetical protein